MLILLQIVLGLKDISEFFFLILSVLIHNPNQRKINQLNTEVWNERKSRKIDGFPVLPETMYETDLLSGNNVSWRVSVYENF